jgi:uncharacterized membrane protein YbhN (UPF0104 family)
MRSQAERMTRNRSEVVTVPSQTADTLREDIALIDRIAFSRGKLAASLAGLAVLAAVVATPPILGSRLGAALDGVSGASPGWLWTAGAGFLAALLASSCAWRAAAAAAGGTLAPGDAAARYAVGSLVNSLTPAKLGDAVRVALFSRAIGGPDALLTAGGVFAAMGAARCLTLAALVVATSASGALPLWPVFVLIAVVAGLGLLAYVERNDRRHRFAHLFDALAALERSPRAAAVVLGWTAASTLAKLCATAAICSALGLPHPMLAALVIVPALDLANVLPLTPGNLGVASGAVAVALQTRGIGMTDALAAGIALHAVETIAGMSAGAAGALYLARGGSGWVLRFSAAAASLLVATAFGATVFDLV